VLALAMQEKLPELARLWLVGTGDILKFSMPEAGYLLPLTQAFKAAQHRWQSKRWFLRPGDSIQEAEARNMRNT